jgi:hypothetical protein
MDGHQEKGFAVPVPAVLGVLRRSAGVPSALGFGAKQLANGPSYM